MSLINPFDNAPDSAFQTHVSAPFIFSNDESKRFRRSFLKLLENETPATGNIGLLDPLVLNEAIASIPINGMYTMRFARPDGTMQYYAINNRTRQKLIDRITEAAADTLEEDEMSTSDKWTYNFVKGNGNSDFTINKYTPPLKPKYQAFKGSFFNRTLKKDLPDEFKNIFSQMQIYDYIKADQAPCLMYALEQAGVSATALSSVRSIMKGKNVALTELPRIATAIEKRIAVTRKRSDDSDTRTTHYGKKEWDEIAIALYDKHFFVDKKLPLNLYALKHFEQLRNKSNWWLFRKSNERNKNSKTRSITALDYMVKNAQHFFDDITDCNDIMNSIHFEESEMRFDDREIAIPAGCSYGQSKSEQLGTAKNVKTKSEKQKVISAHFKTCFNNNAETVPETLSSNEWLEIFNAKKAYTKVGLDFETHTEGEIHKPFMCVASIEAEALRPRQIKRFHGEQCALLALKWLNSAVTKQQNYKPTHCTRPSKSTRPIKMIIHNAGYDWCFLQKHLQCPEKLENNGQLITAKGVFGDFNNPLQIEIKNSYKITPEPLSKFGKLFSLTVEKEVMPYSVYTARTVKAGTASMSDCLKHLPEKDHPHFIENVEKWGCKINDSDNVDIIKYAAIYCDKDVVTMMDGYAKFREMMFQVTELDIDAMATLPAIADAFLKKRGCFDGCRIISGVLRAYIQKFVCGGRVMCKDNAKIKTTTVMDDFDACSLYLSALALMPGFPIGEATNFTVQQLDDPTHKAIKAAKAAFCKIKITKVGKKYAIPLLNMKDENGTRQYTNEMVGECVYADSQTIRDLTEFHQIEYEVVNGVYFEGINNTINDVARELYEWRLKAKAKKNPIQVVLKLLGNSAYGRTLQCARPTSVEYLSKKNFDLVMSKHFEEIDEYTPIMNYKKEISCYRVRRHRSIQDHANFAHVGVGVLSYSKHIMSKVMFLAQDLGISIEYTDTDSMHLARDRVTDLANAYRTKYNTELIGKGIGQFHGDFDLDGADDVRAVESIFLGKKAYIDKLVGTSPSGEEVNGYHIRMKGVPGKAIYAKCEQRKEHPLHRSGSPMDLFKAHYYGAQISYNLLGAPKGQTAGVSFRYEKCGDVYSQKEFSRTVVF